MPDKIFIQALQTKCRIGIFDWERKTLQKIVLDLEFPTDTRKAARRDCIEDALDYKKIAKYTISFVSKSQYFLIETLAEKLAASILKNFPVSGIRLRVSKPGALRFSENVGVDILRKKK